MISPADYRIPWNWKAKILSVVAQQVDRCARPGPSPSLCTQSLERDRRLQVGGIDRRNTCCHADTSRFGSRDRPSRQAWSIAALDVNIFFSSGENGRLMPCRAVRRYGRRGVAGEGGRHVEHRFLSGKLSGCGSHDVMDFPPRISQSRRQPDNYGTVFYALFLWFIASYDCITHSNLIRL